MPEPVIRFIHYAFASKAVIVPFDNERQILRRKYLAAFKKDFEAQTAQIDKVFDSFRLTEQ